MVFTIHQTLLNRHGTNERRLSTTTPTGVSYGQGTSENDSRSSDRHLGLGTRVKGMVPYGFEPNDRVKPLILISRLLTDHDVLVAEVIAAVPTLDDGGPDVRS